MSESASKAPRGGNGHGLAQVARAGDLEELRRSVIRHLDSLESLALRYGADVGRDRGRDEPDADLAGDLMTQFENDRQMLAEAWERLERERLEAGNGRAAGAAAPAARPPRPGDSQLAGCPPQRPAQASGSGASPGSSTAPPSANPVAETILRQFQTLCSDVRRTTDARFSSR